MPIAPTLPRNQIDDAKRAAKAMENIATGWGDDADVTKVESFLVKATANPALFSAFADEFRGGAKVWHPSEIAALLQKNQTGAASPTTTRLMAMTAPPDLDPTKVGGAMKNLATGWYSNDELALMLKQLPGVLADPFAFEAMKSAMGGRGLKVDDGPAAVAAAVIAICNDGEGDAATLKLKRLLAAALAPALLIPVPVRSAKPEEPDDVL